MIIIIIHAFMAVMFTGLFSIQKIGFQEEDDPIQMLVVFMFLRYKYICRGLSLCTFCKFLLYS